MIEKEFTIIAKLTEHKIKILQMFVFIIDVSVINKLNAYIPRIHFFLFQLKISQKTYRRIVKHRILIPDHCTLN